MEKSLMQRFLFFVKENNLGRISFRANIQYNISAKGSNGMKQSEQIEKLITANGGMIQTSQITDPQMSC